MKTTTTFRFAAFILVLFLSSCFSTGQQRYGQKDIEALEKKNTPWAVLTKKGIEQKGEESFFVAYKQHGISFITSYGEELKIIDYAFLCFKDMNGVIHVLGKYEPGTIRDSAGKVIKEVLGSNPIKKMIAGLSSSLLDDPFSPQFIVLEQGNYRSTNSFMMLSLDLGKLTIVEKTASLE